MELPPLVAGSWPRDLEIQLFDACAEHRPVGMYPYAGSTCLQDHLHRSCTILLPQLAVDSFFSHHTFSLPTTSSLYSLGRCGPTLPDGVDSPTSATMASRLDYGEFSLFKNSYSNI